MEVAELRLKSAYHTFDLEYGTIGNLKEIKSRAIEERDALDRLTQDIDGNIQERNEYILEIEDMQSEIQELQDAYTENITSNQERYLTLKTKVLDGSITEEEKKELENIESERKSLGENTKSEIEALNVSISTVNENVSISVDSIEEAYGVIGDTEDTIEELGEWNENYKLGSTYGTMWHTSYIRDNEVVMDDLTTKSDSLRDKIKSYVNSDK